MTEIIFKPKSDAKPMAFPNGHIFIINAYYSPWWQNKHTWEFVGAADVDRVIEKQLKNYDLESEIFLVRT